MSKDMYFELSFVDFDQQGEPHAPGEVEKSDRTKRELLPVLFVDGERKGPVWRRDDRGNLEAVESVEMVRMHWHAYEQHDPKVTTERLEAGEDSSWLYYTKEGSHRPVLELEGEDKNLRDIPFK